MRTCLAISILITLVGESFARAVAPKPNIVVILVDDLGYADVGFNGCEDIRTPNIDRLAKQGAILDCLYGQPVCSPTRAALLTGRYPTHTGVYNVCNPHGKGLRGPLPLSETTLAESLRAAGYTTALCGKWHLGEDEPEYRPTRRGFDHQYGFLGATVDSFTHLYGKNRPKDWYRNDEPSADEGYSTHLLAKEACGIIRRQPADQPLFLYFAPNAVHSPMMSPEEYKAPYEALSRQRKELAGMTAALDEAVGQIVEALDDKGLTNNTIVLFCSDNGGVSWGSSSNRPLRGGKSDIYEGGIRLCSFATWPGTIPAGIHVSEPIHVVDWYPTLCKLAGASLERNLPLDGLDVWPVITQAAKSPHDAILLMGSRPGQRAIRMGEWKLLVNPGEYKNDAANCRPLELYRLTDDIGEVRNFADSQPRRVEKLLGKLDAMTADAVLRDEQFTEPAANKKPTAANDD